MENKELKKKLANAPDVDKDGEPVWKVESPEERTEKRKLEDVPLFLRQHSSSDKGNPQDEKDQTPE